MWLNDLQSRQTTKTSMGKLPRVKRKLPEIGYHIDANNQPPVGKPEVVLQFWIWHKKT